MAALRTTTSLPWAEPEWCMGAPSVYYNETHKKFRNYVRDYVDTYIIPYAMEWEKAGEAPIEARLQYVQSGLAFLDIPTEYRPPALQSVGGVPYAQLDDFHFLILMDELARMPTGITIALAGASLIAAPPILNAGTTAQKLQWLPRLFTWETSLCLGATEPSAGSDISAIKTRATRTPDGKSFVVNGVKKWITGALLATHMVTAVRTGGPGLGGISLLVIPMDAPGVSREKIENSGNNSGGSAWVHLDNVLVDAGNIIGAENNGFRILMTNFNKERYMMAIDCNRQARICLSEALEYSGEREVSGKLLSENQVIRHKATNIAQQLQSHWAWLEQLTYQVSQLGWNSKMLVSPMSLAKIQGGRVIELAARESQQVLGGRGYQRGLTMTEQISRDLRLKVVGGGSEEILHDLAWREAYKFVRADRARL